MERDDGKVRRQERIFKIIKERSVEVDSEEEEATPSERDDVDRKCSVNKDLYKSVYRKSKKLVKISMSRSLILSSSLTQGLE